MPANYESRVDQWRGERLSQYNQLKAFLLRKKLSPEATDREVADLMASWDESKRKQFAKDGLPPPPDEPLPSDPKPPEPTREWRPRGRPPKRLSAGTFRDDALPNAGTVDAREVPAELEPPSNPVATVTKAIESLTEKAEDEPRKEPEPVSKDAIDASDFAAKKRKLHREKHRYPRPDRPIVMGLSWDDHRNAWRAMHNGQHLGYFPDSQWDEAVECRRKSEAADAADKGRGPMSLDELDGQVEFTMQLVALVKRYKPALDVRPVMRRVLESLGV